MDKRIYASARFKFRSDTSVNWQTKNPILLAGEFGVVTDGTESEKVKIGDGVTAWNDLSWWKGAKGDTGAKGDKGDKGEPFVYEDFTQEQLNKLVGPQGPRGIQGETGPQGPEGQKGDNGNDGYTPKRNIDYWTSEDIEEIHFYIDEKLGVIENGSY